ncbi:MAG: hypothetical protein IPO18_06295 [bacterium]|jgi:hypothetical protein|nr:hypothetical protein [bacterium]MBK9777713.1 hypothetical protein [bacterium]
MTVGSDKERLDDFHHRAYDFFKHLTGVSLVSLGGIMGLLGGQGPEVPKVKLIMLLACIGLSGAVSLFTAATMVSSSDPDKGKQMSSRSVHLSLGVAVWSLCLGLGAAIQTFSTLLM